MENYIVQIIIVYSSYCFQIFQRNLVKIKSLLINTFFLNILYRVVIRESRSMFRRSHSLGVKNKNNSSYTGEIFVILIIKFLFLFTEDLKSVVLQSSLNSMIFVIIFPIYKVFFLSSLFLLAGNV